jgi:hypothetical protein
MFVGGLAEERRGNRKKQHCDDSEHQAESARTLGSDRTHIFLSFTRLDQGGTSKLTVTVEILRRAYQA